MDKARRFHIYSQMKKSELLDKALKLAEVSEAMREWIDSVPENAELPTMPGFDRDWADNIIDSA